MMDAQAVLRCQDGDREAVHHREDQYQDLRAGRLKNSPRITRIRRKVLAAAGRCRIAAVVAGAAIAVTVLAATACGEAQVVEKTATVTEVREVMEEAPRPAPTAAATAAATAAPTAAAAATPRVVIKEVIKEVPVVTVVTRVVIKEVPVETVVMKEVVKEVAVEKIVTAPPAAHMEASFVEKSVTVTVTEIKEVVTRDAAAAERAGDAAADTRPSRPVELTAGEVDDNQRWTDYLRYRGEYRGPPVHDVDVSERYTITVLDALGRPVPNAQVSISGGEEPIFEGRTYANGQTLFFPRAFPGTANARTFRLEVEKDGVSRSLDAKRDQESEWTVHLDVDQSYGDRVPLDLLFLLDATGSMDDEIDQIKTTLLSISERINALPSHPDLRFGMVTYRDRGDDFVTRVYDFDADVPTFLSTIQDVIADGGDDYQESLNEALHVAVRRPSWRLDDAIRLIVLVAAAPPHLDYVEDYDYAAEMIEANRRGMKIFTIASSGLDNQGEYIFRQIAQHTMGRFIFILYGGETSHSVSEYSVEQLDALVVRLVQEELAHVQPN